MCCDGAHDCPTPPPTTHSTPSPAALYGRCTGRALRCCAALPCNCTLPVAVDVVDCQHGHSGTPRVFTACPFRLHVKRALATCKAICTCVIMLEPCVTDAAAAARFVSRKRTIDRARQARVTASGCERAAFARHRLRMSAARTRVSCWTPSTAHATRVSRRVRQQARCARKAHSRHGKEAGLRVYCCRSRHVGRVR